MSQRQVGIWFIGAFGGVASTVTLGLAALKPGLGSECGMVTGLPPFVPGEALQRPETLLAALEKGERVLPASSLYAWAALDLGLPYINFTPSLGASFPAAEELAIQRRTVIGGKDGKTGETLMKTVL